MGRFLTPALAALVLAGCGSGGSVFGDPVRIQAQITEATPSTVTLTWTPVAGSPSYRVLRDNTEIGSTKGAAWRDLWVDSDLDYTYKIVAERAQGLGFVTLGRSDALPVHTPPPANWLREDLSAGIEPRIVIDGSGDELLANCAGAVHECWDAIVVAPGGGLRTLRIDGAAALWCDREQGGVWTSEFVDAGPLDFRAEAEKLRGIEKDQRRPLLLEAGVLVGRSVLRERLRNDRR